MIDLARYRYDVDGFARDVLGIKLHPGQVSFANEVVKRHPRRRWRAAYLTVALAAGNRAGKTMILAVVIIHSVVYKMGMKLPEDEKGALKWLKASYMWFHFAIQQEIAELVYTDIVNLLSGNHVAQRDGCPLADSFEEQGMKAADWEHKYNGDYRWIVFSPALGGGEIHFRTTAEKALGSLGRDMHGISFDECGLEKNLTWIVNNVMHLRRLGTGGQLLLVSTPEEGFTEFADFWYMGDPTEPDRRKGRMSVRMSTRDNIGYGIQQYDFDALVADMDDDHIKQNIDGYFIQGRTAYFNAQSVMNAFVEGMDETRPAQKNHQYVQGVDPALRADSTWSIVFDCTNEIAFGVRAERIKGKQTTDAIVALAMNAHNAYDVQRNGFRSTCQTAIDATGFGGKMFREALEKDIPGVRSIEFGGTTQKKRKLLGDLRTMLDQGRLKMPLIDGTAWMQVRRQLLGYKLDDRSIEQDAVMALACLVAEIRRTPPDSFDTVEFDAFALPVRHVPSEWQNFAERIK